MNLVAITRDLAGPAGDSSFENRVAKFLREVEREARDQCLMKLLTDENPAVRYMTLRLIKRVALEKKSFDQIVSLSHSVLRYTEIQEWYQALLARHPVARLVRLLAAEIEARADPDFKELRVQAIRMCSFPSMKTKQLAMRHLLEPRSRSMPVRSAGEA